MEKKKTILFIVLVLLLTSTAIVLYRGLSARPLTIVSQTVSSRDVEIRNQVDAVKIKIIKAVREVEDGGSLDKLTESKQFQELSTESLKPIVVGDYGRSNPFVPPALER